MMIESFHCTTRYFNKIIHVLSSPPFYTNYVKPPSGQTIPSKIRHNPTFWPFFRGAISAINGSHIPIFPPAFVHGKYRNHKGFLSQNALFVCDFNIKFTYMLTGWEGSATDAHVYDDAITSDLHIPEEKYLLADAGYPLRRQLLVPYRGVRYHLAEWGRANVWYVFNLPAMIQLIVPYYRPANREELFNLRHASARNVIEQVFGVLK
jgi:hypothetical protein